MKISISVLKSYINIPTGYDNLIDLFEDLGLEVKRVDAQEGDTVLTLELLANRGDLHSYMGVALELHARTGWQLSPPAKLPVVAYSRDPVVVSIESNKCLAYHLAYFSTSNIYDLATRPYDGRLMDSAGVNSINLPVDIGNFVGLELGQPLHVFDADLIVGRICVRETTEGEVAHPLFYSDPIVLPTETLVIADDVSILAIAGVIGCEYAKPTVATRQIFVESALFDPIKIRRTAKALGLQTLASMRFERGGDGGLQTAALERAAALFCDVGWGCSGVLTARTFEEGTRTIKLEIASFEKFTGTHLEAEVITRSLLAYGYQLEEIGPATFGVKVPTARYWDVIDEIDLYEEICRFAGYGNLTNTFPTLEPSELGSPRSKITRRNDVEEIILSNGFFEIFTNGFYSDDVARKLGSLHHLRDLEHIRVLNGQERAYSLMKTNNVAQALELTRLNFDHKIFDGKVFEWSRTYHPGQVSICERKVLWCAASGMALAKTWKHEGREVDVYWLQGILAAISTEIGIPFKFRQTSLENPSLYPVAGPMMHPLRAADILIDDAVCGVVGEVHPQLARAFGLKKGRLFFFELVEEYLQRDYPNATYSQPSNTQLVSRDVNFGIPQKFSSARLIELLKAGAPSVSSATVIDSYAAVGQIVLTIRITFDPANLGKTSLPSDLIAAELEATVQYAQTALVESGVVRQ